MTMPPAKIRATLAVALFALSFLWLWDASVHGFQGFVSRYIAPVIIVGNLINAYWGLRETTANLAKWKGTK